MPLTPKQLTEFELLLQLRKKELLDFKAVGDESANTVTLDQTRVGRLSRMDAMQAQAMAKETNRRRDIELTKIDNALARIETEEYGYCLACDEDIALARLKLDPSATLCIDCANKNG